MEILVLGHLLGEFYLQTDKLAKEKKKKKSYFALHCFIYLLVMWVAIVCATLEIMEGIVLAVILSVTHWIFDLIILKYFKHRQYVWYVVREICEIMVIVVVCFFRKTWSLDTANCMIPYINKMSLRKLIVIVDCVLICWRPTVILIKSVFNGMPKDLQVQKEQAGKDLNCGKWIGILEREIILILGIIGQYGAIGFVLTAKSFARYEQLKEKQFAERYLVGTLLSALIALSLSAICNLVD